MITRMDVDVGRVIARLKEYGIDDRTLVIFSSDNGHHREGGNDPAFFDANGPLRGMKRDLYEGGIRVATIARWPGRIEPGTSSGHASYFGDLMATAAELTSQPVPSGLDSVSFLPSLLGRDKAQGKHDYIYWEFLERGGAQAIVMGEWKALRKGRADAPIEVYNLAKDLGEQTDISSKNPEIVAIAERVFMEAHVDSPVWNRPFQPRKKR